MKKNTIKTELGIEVYTSKIYELADEYINDLDNPEDIKGANKGVFTGMVKYIYLNLFKNNPLDNGNIQELDDVWNVYTSLCYKYSKRPTILSFSIMIGVNNDTINAWKNGEYRNGPGSLHSLTVKKWLAECESALLDGAVENNGIGCIFALKANYGYTETAPAQVPYSGDHRQSLEEIQHRYISDNREESTRISRLPDADFG